jgi:hypothetical protein
MLLPSIAVADPGWYVSADAGRTTFSTTAKFDVSLAPPGTTSPFVFTDDERGRRMLVGFRPDSYWSIEAGYVDLGQTMGNTSVITQPSGPSSCGLPCENSYNLEASLKAHGETLDIVGSLPLGDQWSLFLRAGLIRSRLELDNQVVPTNNPPYGNTSIPADTNQSVTGLRHTYGVGVSWHFASHWAAHLSWDRYIGLGNSNTTWNPDVELRSVGIEYRF